MAGAQCCDNPPELDHASGNGMVLDSFGGLKSYVTGNSHTTTNAIILISDIFGFEAPNLRKLADKVATAGFFVVVPDFLHGDPYDPNNPENPLQTWLKSHGTAKGSEDAKAVIDVLKSKGVTAIGVAGFCWGAKVVGELAKCDAIKAAVMLHPSFVTVDDIKEIVFPIAVLGAQFDKVSPPELLKQFEEILSTKSEVDSFVKVFPGVSHGWTTRYDANDESAVKKAEEAYQDMLNWFVKYVK